jgi:type IV pilus assembly protein PilW
VTSARPGTERPSLTRGASLIELMVGLVVGLLVSLAAAKSAEFFTASQRQGVAVTSGSSNAMSALAAVKDDVISGGMGFFVNGSYRCASLNLSVGASRISDGAAFAPVQATRDGSNDVLDVVYADDVASGAWSQLHEVSAGSSATLASMLPVTAGQTPTVLLARKPDDAASPCVVRTTTASAAPTAADKQLLTFGATGDHNKALFTNEPTFKEHSPVMMLTGLQWNRYRLDGTNLIIERRLQNTQGVLLRNVIGFRVLYGISVASPRAVEDWVDTQNAGFNAITAVNVGRVRAMRIGVVLRSPQPEKKVGGACEATLTKPKLFDVADEVEIEPDVSDWQCYRYRSVVVVAPLRNLTQGTEAIAWPKTTITP